MYVLYIRRSDFMIFSRWIRPNPYLSVSLTRSYWPDTSVLAPLSAARYLGYPVILFTHKNNCKTCQADARFMPVTVIGLDQNEPHFDTIFSLKTQHYRAPYNISQHHYKRWYEELTWRNFYITDLIACDRTLDLITWVHREGCIMHNIILYVKILEWIQSMLDEFQVVCDGSSWSTLKKFARSLPSNICEIYLITLSGNLYWRLYMPTGRLFWPCFHNTR